MLNGMEIESRPVTLRTSYLVIALGFGAIAFEGLRSNCLRSGCAVTPGLPRLGAYARQSGSSWEAFAFLGMFFGAPAAGWLSDRFGRRRLFIGLLAFFSLMMLLVSVAPTPFLFGLFRFLAGLAFGGIPPTAIAQAFEFSPPHRRVLFNSIMLSGFGVGAILAGGPRPYPVAHSWLPRAFRYRLSAVIYFGSARVVCFAGIAGFPQPSKQRFDLAQFRELLGRRP